MQLEGVLKNSAQKHPEKIALICGDQRVTYREIEEQSNRLASALVALGIERGDRVATCLDNSLEGVFSIFAILKAGAAFVIVDRNPTPDRLFGILNHSEAKMLLVHSRMVQAIEGKRRLLSSLRSVVMVGEDPLGDEAAGQEFLRFEDLLRQGACGPLPSGRAIDVDLASVIYTSGSTGAAKGVMMTHQSMLSALRSITSFLKNGPDEIILNVLPLSFDYGLYQVLLAFESGGTLVLERSFAYPHVVLKKAEAEKVTAFPLVPTLLALLLQIGLERYDLSSLRYVTSTGGPLPTRHILEFRRRFPSVDFFSMYGLTECKRVSYLAPGEIDRRPTSVGKGMENEEVYIVDEQGRRVGPGVEGELVVRGSHVMRGYWRMPEETGKVLRTEPDTWDRVLYSGDLFRMDHEGYLYFVGRKDEMIKCRDRKVSPKEIENALYDLEGIQEAVVVGVPDEIVGQAIKAVVMAKPGAVLTETMILGHLSQRLEKYMIPKIIEIRNQIPKTSTGKFDKLALSVSRVEA